MRDSENTRRYLLLVAVVLVSGMLVSLSGHTQESVEQHATIAPSCLQSLDPLECMLSYGFDCDVNRSGSRSFNARSVSCNLDLGDGRLHYAQFLYEDGGWVLETQNTYDADYSDFMGHPHEDPDLALSQYLRAATEDIRRHDGGSFKGYGNRSIHYVAGATRDDEPISVRALCGIVTADTGNADLLAGVRSDCESRLLRLIRKLAQVAPDEPFRIPNPAVFKWQTRTEWLVSGDSALILSGRFDFAERHEPCRWQSDCCSIDGASYLESCRVPNSDEIEAINACVVQEGKTGTPGFVACMRDAGINIDCELQG